MKACGTAVSGGRRRPKATVSAGAFTKSELIGGTVMRRLAGIVHVVALAVLLPSIAYAQASITGTVKDSSGAVLPGVTVEASSPALIEKVRTVVSDGSGQYRIVDLRPGTYSVTFTLTGFN